MQKNTAMWLVGGVGAYYFLSTRQPMYTQQIDGSWLPATFIDRLTVAITGVAPPPPAPPTNQQTIASVVNALTPLISQFNPVASNTN